MLAETHHRLIRSRKAELALPDLLQSLLSAELLAPSHRIWIVSPWISNIPIIENSSGEFSSLVPEWEFAPVRLAQYVTYLTSRGTDIYVVTRPDERTQDFANLMRQLGATLPDQVHMRNAALVHEKGLLTDHFFLSGSFNYTLTGITMNDEAAHLFTDPGKVAEQHIAYGNIWAEQGEW